MTIKKQKFINRKIKWSLVDLGTLIILTLLGFISLLFGGRFIVNEDNFILPATTTVETANVEVIGELFEERRYPVMIEVILDYIQVAIYAVYDDRFYIHI